MPAPTEPRPSPDSVTRRLFEGEGQTVLGDSALLVGLWFSHWGDHTIWYAEYAHFPPIRMSAAQLVERFKTSMEDYFDVCAVSLPGVSSENLMLIVTALP